MLGLAVAALVSLGIVVSPAVGAAAGPGGRAQPLAGRTIVLDPGHNGGNAAHAARIGRIVDAGNGVRKPCNTTGTATNSGYRESAFTLDVARRVAIVLRAGGARVVMTRTTDTGWGPCIDARAAVGNSVAAAAVLSIHADGNLRRGARGFHVIRSTRMTGGPDVVARSSELATDVRAAFETRTGEPRSSYLGAGTAITPRRDIGGLNLSRRPAVMVETGNMRDAADARSMRSPAWRQRAAAGLAAALQQYVTGR
jgi:N-acetylmuramoyl-L-alanine amidase